MSPPANYHDDSLTDEHMFCMLMNKLRCISRMVNDVLSFPYRETCFLSGNFFSRQSMPAIAESAAHVSWVSVQMWCVVFHPIVLPPLFPLNRSIEQTI